MLANVLTKSIRDRWIAVSIGAFGLGLMLLGGMAVYRDIDLSIYYSLPEGWLEMMGITEEGGAGGLAFGAIYGTIGALTIAGLAISMGSRSIAGEESNGTLGLLLGNPTSRTSVLGSKLGSMVALIVAACAVLWLAALVAPDLLSVEVGGMHLGALVLAMGVNALLYGFLAAAVGAWTGSGSAASGTAVAVMMVSFLASGLLPLVDNLAGYARAFPWYYYASSEPLYNGIDAGHLGVLLGGVVVLAVLSLVGVNRRDLRNRTVGVSLVDRLRHHPLTQRMADVIAGSARVSTIWVKSASEHQGLLIITALVMFFTGIFIGPMYALIDDALADFAANLPDVLMAMVGQADMATPEGWLQTEVFSIMAPAAAVVVTVTLGAKGIAGEEQRHTMGLLLASPIRRSRVVLEKSLTMIVYAIGVGVATFAGTWVGSLIGGLGVSPAGITAATVLCTLLGLAFGGLALVLGAATGRSSVAASTAAGVAIVAYIADSFLSVNEATEAWAVLSPFHYLLSSDPLNNGMDWGHASVLTALFVVLVALSIPLFQARDLRG